MSWKDFLPDHIMGSDLKDAFLAIYQAASYDDPYSSAVSAAVAASIVKQALDETHIKEKMKGNFKVDGFNGQKLLWYAMQQICSAQLEHDQVWKARSLKNALKALKKYIKETTGNKNALTPQTSVESNWEVRYYAD